MSPCAKNRPVRVTHTTNPIQSIPPRSRQLCSGATTRDNTKDLQVLPGTEQNNDDALGFDIEPRYGVFPANCKTQVTLRYSANTEFPTASSIDSVLVVEGVPPSSIPSDEQAGLLAALAVNGHGKFLRMQAWFKKMDKVSERAKQASERALRKTSILAMNPTKLLQA